MELIWMPNAQEDYLDTLAYWYKHNGFLVTRIRLTRKLSN